MRIRTKILGTLASVVSAALAMAAIPGQARAADNDIVVGFAVALSGGMNAYDGEATKMAQLWIDQTNAKGGLLGKQIKSVYADTKSDRVEGARAGLKVIQEGSVLVFATADYDYGAPAALQAQKAGKISVFLGASDPKAGVIGVGPFSFSAEKAAQLEGATVAEWGYEKMGYRNAYVLDDTAIEYDKSTCAGFNWAFPKEGGTIVGSDTFKNDDPSISSQVTRITNAVRDHKVDVLMLCTYQPGGSSAVRQLRDGGINVPILNGSSMDGTYWINAVPNLKDFYVPVQAVVSGDPLASVQTLTTEYAAKYGKPPTTAICLPDLRLAAALGQGRDDRRHDGREARCCHHAEIHQRADGPGSAQLHAKDAYPDRHPAHHRRHRRRQADSRDDVADQGADPGRRALSPEESQLRQGSLMQTGESLLTDRPGMLSQPQAAELTAEKVVVRFGGLAAISDVSLTVRRGEVFGLIGPNGAGQDNAGQLPHRLPGAHLRAGAAGGRRHGRLVAGQVPQAGRGAHLPGRPLVPRHDGPGEC